MGHLTDRLDSLFLSAQNIRELTGWTDAMIEDYLNIIRNILEIAQEVETGGTVAEGLDQLIATNNAQIGWLKSRMVAMKRFELITVTTDYTTKGNQILICRNAVPITITLDPDAVFDDEVNIKRKDSKVNYIGSVDGKEFTVINVKNYSSRLIYDGLDWSEI